jgi:hypothetical protein
MSDKKTPAEKMPLLHYGICDHCGHIIKVKDRKKLIDKKSFTWLHHTCWMVRGLI